MPLAAAPYRASGLVLWRKADVPPPENVAVRRYRGRGEAIAEPLVGPVVGFQVISDDRRARLGPSRELIDGARAIPVSRCRQPTTVNVNRVNPVFCFLQLADLRGAIAP
jgi:hypothetical protein